MSAAGGAGAAAGAAGAAAIIQAVRASGVIVRVDADNFLSVLRRVQAPLVVTATAGWLTTKYRYLTSYKSLEFFTESPDPLTLPAGVEVVEAEKIWIPG